MAGIDRNSGGVVAGWSHVQQSLRVLFTTPLLKRVMRRYVGSNVPRLVDAPISPVTVIQFYAAVAKAIRDFEPRFRVARMQVNESTVDTAALGGIVMDIQGVYYPRGHLGDFTVSEPKTVSVPL